MDNQSSKYIIPFSIFVVAALVFLFGFTYLAESNGWFSNTDELVENLTVDETPVVSFPVSFGETEKQLKPVSKAELQENNTLESCYTVINNNAYLLPQEFIEKNTTDIFDENVCGNDVTDIFESQVDYVITDLEDYLLGEYVLIKTGNAN